MLAEFTLCTGVPVANVEQVNAGWDLSSGC